MTRLPDDPPMPFRAHLFMCTNRRPPGHPWGSCGEKGSQELAEHLKATYKDMGLEDARVTLSGCLGRCDKAPALVIYPEGVWYTVNSPADVEEVLKSHLAKGERVKHLMVPAA
ncbi:MAG: (2Fe-2S) ferredoxin domain-containing protein [Rhodospirillales bacterium]|nr:MAG: (2Fe-2S) ferredoxin domain-containing protein [Rhodospirillales bacterium]